MFCDKYAIHADEKDIRKITSLFYVIKETQSLASSEKHFNDLFGDVLNRIESILSAIKSQSGKQKNLVESISEDVFDRENLNTYWQHKLDMLVRLGVV